MSERDDYFMRRAIALAEKGMSLNKGGPFGAVIVKGGKIIAEGYNTVTSSTDPTAHAEVIAIRKACEKLNSFQLEDCTIYTSCEPCPMCLGAIYWARPKRVYYACSKDDATQIGFDDQFIYDEIDKKISKRNISFIKILGKEGKLIFDKWEEKEDKTIY